MTSSPFQLRGVIEGFYGVYYTVPERNNLIRFLSENGYNLYIYGPKDDWQHRDQWRHPYPEEVMNQFAETINLSQNAGVDFCYSISPGISINYALDKELETVKSKCRSFYNCGVRTFALLLDDIAPGFRYEEEKEKFSSYAQAHVAICNEFYKWLKGLDPSCRLLMCPTDYHGTAPFSDYIHELGEGLHQDIEIFYTGPEVCSQAIGESDVDDFAAAAGRPPVLWDNYPVNDGAMEAEMHIGPIIGRQESLATKSRGFAVNTMIQAEASKVSLLTFADYFNDPHHYDPWPSWEEALKKVGGADSYDALKLFAENALISCLRHENSKKLGSLVDAFLSALKSGQNMTGHMAVRELEDYLARLDEACYHLKNRMANYSLRNNLLPWVQLLEHWSAAGKKALEILTSTECGSINEKKIKGIKKSLQRIKNHDKRMTDESLLSVIEYAIERAEAKFAAETAGKES